jgi:hypothetical protein
MNGDNNIRLGDHFFGALIKLYWIGVRNTYRERKSPFSEFLRRIKVFLHAIESRDDRQSLGCLYRNGLTSSGVSWSENEFNIFINYSIPFDDLPTYPFQQIRIICRQARLGVLEWIVRLFKLGTLNDSLGP